VLGGEVGLGRVDFPCPENWPGQLDLLRLDLHRQERGVPQDAAPVRTVVQQRTRAGLLVRGRDRGDLGADRFLGVERRVVGHAPNVTRWSAPVRPSPVLAPVDGRPRPVATWMNGITIRTSSV